MIPKSTSLEYEPSSEPLLSTAKQRHQAGCPRCPGLHYSTAMCHIHCWHIKVSQGQNLALAGAILRLVGVTKRAARDTQFCPMSSQHGTCKTVTARFWPCLAGKRSCTARMWCVRLQAGRPRCPGMRSQAAEYRGTSLSRNCPPRGPNSGNMPRALRWS